MSTIVCFHNPSEENGFLSNWWTSQFHLCGTKYESVEQYMMHCKALLFKDFNTAKLILRESDPKYIKDLGRKVQNYDDALWAANRYNVVRNGVTAKVCQCDEIRQALLQFPYDSIFAECAVRDKIWGIGLSMTDPKRFDQSEWRGSNLLGKIWTDLRHDLQQ